MTIAKATENFPNGGLLLFFAILNITLLTKKSTNSAKRNECERQKDKGHNTNEQ